MGLRRRPRGKSQHRKSTVFNALTGLHQHTGNWPGKTISRAEGGFSYRKMPTNSSTSGHLFPPVDLDDKQVAREFILFGQPDVTVVVLTPLRLSAT